ncbi:hypothetical protein GGS24DRAFT_68550 [Hypoxylon argillaceum]|nr:hypothetical protein GGS24DRAFT_68550 [Hypoxylon argillaceum]
MAKDADGKPIMPRHDGDVEAIPFSCERECRMQLMVGQRAYRLPPLCHFRLGSLLLPSFDSYALHNRWPPLSDADWAPFITGVLIGMAQANSPSFADESVVVQTRLLFTNHGDKKHIQVYTARVSQALLERFRHPTQPPTTTSSSPSLIKLRQTRVSFQPPDTFRCRLLAAVSVTTATMPEETYFGYRKRKSSRASDETVVKRRRREGQPAALCGLDADYYSIW